MRPVTIRGHFCIMADWVFLCFVCFPVKKIGTRMGYLWLHKYRPQSLLVSLASYMYILVSLYSTFTHFSHFTYVYNNLHLLTLPSHLGIGETIYHLFHYTLLHSAKDKWTNNLYVTLSDVRGTFPVSPPYCKKLNYSSQFY